MEVGGQTAWISDAAAAAAACYWAGQSASLAPMELIGRKAGDLSANCTWRRRPFGRHPSINLSRPARLLAYWSTDVPAEITRSKVKQCRRWHWSVVYEHGAPAVPGRPGIVVVAANRVKQTHDTASGSSSSSGSGSGGGGAERDGHWTSNPLYPLYTGVHKTTL